MSDKMNKLKEVAGENELDKELLDLIAGGNKAQTEELWNFYMTHGAGGFLKKYQKNHAKGVLEALKKENVPGLCHMKSISNANADNEANIYHGIYDFPHKNVMKMLNETYSRGDGFFGQTK